MHNDFQLFLLNFLSPTPRFTRPHVAVTVTKDDTKPTDAPSTVPSDTPSDAPTDTPTDAPTDAPSTAPTTLGKITELKATKASRLTATFDSAVPEGTTVEVTKGSNKVDGKYTIDGSTIVFDATASFTEGKYTLTATLGDAKESAETDVKASYVADIVIKSEEALTKEIPSATGSSIAGKEAYIYFDVLNQYGESVKDKETVTWSLSVGNETKKVDKSLGRITVKVDKDALSLLNYGSFIYVTGVHTGSGASVTKSVPVGMAQAVDSIEFAGFINKDDPTKLVENLPVNFPVNKYVLAYRTFDQQKNPLEVTGKEIANQDLTFIADNALLIDPTFKDADSTFTVDGVKYSAITINPGEFAGKGGEVNITAIASRTGQRTVKNFVIGAAALLQSLSLEAPADTVASGDKDVKLGYTAKDVDGKSVTNYETIVRSSNTLNLTAGAGILKVKEENDGTAGIYWSDDTNATIAEDYNDKATDRIVSLGTTVIGGDNNNSILMLTVSPARHPVAIKSIKLNDDDSNAIVDKMKAEIDFASDKVVYLDQYGKELKGDAKNVLENKIVEQYLAYNTDNRVRAIRVTVDDNNALLGLAKKNLASANKITITADAGNNAKEVNVSYALVTAPKPNSGSVAPDSDAWENVDNAKSISYTVVPISEVDDPQISAIGKQQIVTDATGFNNFDAYNADKETKVKYIDKTTVIELKSGKKADWSNSNAFSVKGVYKNKTVTIPGDWYNVAAVSGSAFTISTVSGSGISTITGIRDGELHWGELYDENSNKGSRIDAIKRLVLAVAKDTKGGTNNATTKVTLSDAKAVASDIRFQEAHWKWDVTEITLLPKNTEIEGAGLNNPNPHFAVAVYDQYGKEYKEDGFNGWDGPWDGGKFLEYTVSDKKESTSEFAHLPNSFKVSGSGSTCDKLKITGAELGDTFTLTATIPDTSISKSIKVTVGADQSAFIANKSSKSASWVTEDDLKADSDKTFRTDILGYKK